MAKIAKQITEDGDTLLCDVRKPRNAGYYLATVCISGTFGGGTAKLQVSPDRGVTKIDAVDESGEAITATGSYIGNIKLGASIGNEDAPQLYVNVNGSTSAEIDVVLFDNF